MPNVQYTEGQYEHYTVQYVHTYIALYTTDVLAANEDDILFCIIKTRIILLEL